MKVFRKDKVFEALASIPIKAHVVVMPHYYNMDLLIVTAKSQAAPDAASGNDVADRASI